MLNVPSSPPLNRHPRPRTPLIGREREVADLLFISPHTVANYVANIMNKLGVESRTAAAIGAVRNGIA